MKITPKINNFFKQNSPTILTVIGCVGVGITAIMAARDTMRAMRKIEDDSYQAFQRNRTVTLSTKEKIKIAAPCYIPTALTGLSTMLCICGANKLNRNMQKSLTSAYVLLDQSYKEFRKSVREVHGEDGEIEVIKNISYKKAAELGVPEYNDSDVFFDFFSLQFFNSKLSKIKEVETIANDMLRTHGYISLKTMYSLIGVDTFGTDNLLGWSVGAGKAYGYDHIEIDVDEMIREDGSKYYILDFVHTPTEDYLRIL